MLIPVVNPWILVESCPGLISQTLCGVPVFWFSVTIGFGFNGAAVAVRVAVPLGVAVVVTGAAVVAGVALPVLVSNGRPTLLGIRAPPGITSSKLKCEFCGTAGFGLKRSPAVCAGVRLCPTLTGVLPSDSTTVPFVGSSVTFMVSEDAASLGTAMLSARPKTEL